MQCGRVFASMHFLRKHYERRHPGADFDRDYPSEKDKDRAREDAARREQEEIKANQERLFKGLKSDMLAQMTQSIKLLE